MILHWIHTSDVHGHLDALSGVETFVRRLRSDVGAERVVFTDGGDALQGHPLVYYHNHVDTASPHIVPQVMNRMHYDCMAVGNHDIEVGPSVFDRAFRQMSFPVLCSNVEGPFLPYTIIEKCGFRIAVLSLLTTQTTHWISPSQYHGMQFVDPVQSARHWIAYLREHAEFDMLVGLLHVGWEGDAQYPTDSVRSIAEQVPDFDLILYGHDHHQAIHRVGHTLCVAPYSLASSFVELTIDTATRVVTPRLIPNSYKSTSCQSAGYRVWLDRHIGTVDTGLCEFDSYFGASPFMLLTHQLLLSATRAQVSLAAPVSYDAYIPRGPLTNRDLFRLYDRDSQLYTMHFTLDELRGILEYSASLWTNVMTSPTDHALLLDYVLDGGTRLGLKHFTIHFLSAYGLEYTVDLTRPYDQKVDILSAPSPHDAPYLTVAVNSYHANGGGDVLTRGVRLSHAQLRERIVRVEQSDLRQCLAREISRRVNIHLANTANWHFIPEAWATPALRRDRAILDMKYSE